MSITDDVEIYDNTFTLNNTIKLIKLFNDYQSKGIKKMHGHFHRFKNENLPLNKRYNNPFEYLIDDFLKKKGDMSSSVEYWYRAKWTNMPCHQDLNEYIVKEYGRVYNPNNGHILYLSESCNQTATILFNKEMTALTLVYPKIGRIVRFNGEAHHAVPKPFERIYKKQRETNTDGMDDIFRHVLLFNTWDNYVPDPNEFLIKGDIRNPIEFNPMREWNKLPLFDSIPVFDDQITIEMMYMGNAKCRFGFNKFGDFQVSSRLKTDGYSQRMIAYDVILDEKTHTHSCQSRQCSVEND